MYPVHSLAARWSSKAEELRRYGAEEAASTLEACAVELEDCQSRWEAELLTLEEAAAESGYSCDHLGRLLSGGVIPNAGEPYAPRIRRMDLPRKPGHLAQPTHLDRSVTSRMQMARSVVESE